MLRIFFLLLALYSLPAVAIEGSGERPDPALTPGAVRVVSTEELCDKSKHTSDVRNVPGSLKLQIYRAYGFEYKRDGWCNSNEGCEVDHLISLELGGSNEPENLWPEPYAGTVWNAHVKDVLENKLHALVCAGRISLSQAQSEISTDWIASYKLHIGENPPE